MALDLPIFLFQLLVILTGAGLARGAAKALGQPGVLGEILFGVALGPSLLGWVSPQAEAWLFPEDNAPVLEALGWIGLVLFMYIAGSEMRWSWSDRQTILLTAGGGLVVPLTIGLALALAAPDWFFEGGPSLRRAAIVAIVVTVSALPVLARLLRDVDLLDHPIGAITMGAGTVDDVLAWMLLALVAGSDIGLTGHFLANLLLVLGIFALALLADRLLHPFVRRIAPEPRPLFLWLLAAILVSATLTHLAGLHAVIGPLVVGAVMSRHPVLRDYAATRLGDLTLALLLPTFFVLAGRQADLTLLDGNGWLTVLAVTLAASAAKVVGVYLGARAANVTQPASLVAGILLNARGAVGLVVAKVGLDAGLLSARGFALLVLVVVLTTLLAPPALAAYGRWLAAHAPRNASTSS